MDEAIDIIQSGGTVQIIHTLIMLSVSTINMFIFPFLPFLLKYPEFLCSPKDDYKPFFTHCNQHVFCEQSTELNYSVDGNNSLHNWALSFNIYCSSSNANKFIACYLIGSVVLSLVFAYVGDNYGRKKLYQYLTVVNAVGYLLLTIPFNTSMICLGMFVQGVSSYLIAFSSVIVTEYLTRANSGWLTALNTSGSFLLCLFMCVVYVHLNSTLLMFVIVVGMSCGVCYYTFSYATESCFWFICKNRVSECFNMLKQIAYFNGRINDFENINQERFETDKVEIISHTDFIWNIFKYDSQRKRLIVHSILWFCCSFSFFGVIFQISLIESEFNKKYFLSYLAVFLSQVITGIIADVYGRQRCVMYASYLSGIACFVFALASQDHVVKLISFMFVLLGSSASNSVLFIFTAEDFPTAIRCTVMGFVFVISRLAGLVAYFVVSNITKPELLFALLSCSAGRISELLEDTHELILDDEVPENKKDLPFKKKRNRALRKDFKSGCSDLYFLTSDDESFNKGQLYV